MKEAGILMSAPMVRALLAGRKTQTRRPAKLPGWWPKDAARAVLGPGPQFWPVDVRGRRIGNLGLPARQCRYGMGGDRLWVRETWAPHPRHPRRIHFQADMTSWLKVGGERGPAWDFRETITVDCPPPVKWKPSIHLPRWASRITLLVTELRLERVRSISRADAIAEGFEAGVMMDGTVNGEPAKIAVMDPVYWFAMLWNTIHGSGAFAEDPWTWVVSFRVISGA